MKTVIEISDDCFKCPCYITAEATVGQNKKIFHLCRAFGRILSVGVNGYGNVKAIDRCAECEDAEIKKEDAENHA